MNANCPMPANPHGPTPLKDSCIAVIAAGNSRRMGICKQTLDLAGEAMVHRACRIALDADPGEVFLICGRDYDAISHTVSNLPVDCAYNGLYETGQAASVRMAANLALAGGYASLCIIPADMPFLTAGHLTRLAEGLRRPGMIAAASATRPALVPMAPCLFAPEAMRLLCDLQGDRGALQVIRNPSIRPKVAIVPFDDPLMAFDVDTPEDYAQVLALVSQAKRPAQQSDPRRHRKEARP
ncbi:MAG: nucleotidyltransferase family protein [Eggerthellales bacterium]|nr:nucleotidyltransferase family protein [Eggerthellales bacterium]